MRIFPVIAIALQVTALSCPANSDELSPTVLMERYDFYDQCFYGTVKEVVQHDDMAEIELGIEQKLRPGKCGCTSLLLKALVYSEAIGETSDKPKSRELAFETQNFRYDIGQYNFSLKNFNAARNYTIFLSCAS